MYGCANLSFLVFFYYTPTHPTHNFLPLPSFPSQGLQTEVNVGLDTVEGRHIQGLQACTLERRRVGLPNDGRDRGGDQIQGLLHLAIVARKRRRRVAGGGSSSGVLVDADGFFLLLIKPIPLVTDAATVGQSRVIVGGERVGVACDTHLFILLLAVLFPFLLYLSLLVPGGGVAGVVTFLVGMSIHRLRLLVCMSTGGYYVEMGKKQRPPYTSHTINMHATKLTSRKDFHS